MISPSLDSAVSLILRRVAPLLIIMLICNQLNRSNIGQAQKYLEADVGIGAAAHDFGAGVFFGYALIEFPSLAMPVPQSTATGRDPNVVTPDAIETDSDRTLLHVAVDNPGLEAHFRVSVHILLRGHSERDFTREAALLRRFFSVLH